MSLAIILLNWNQAADTIASVQAIQAWPIASKTIWVVDSASAPPDIERITRSCPGIRLICSEVNRGFAGGNNLALDAALQNGCDEMLLLNNDVRVSYEDILRLQQVLCTHPEVGIVGPMLWDSVQRNTLLSAGGRDIAHHISSHRLDPVADGVLRQVDHVPGTCVLIRASVLHATGLLDEDFFFGGEVAALCKRALQCGYSSMVVGGADAFHAVDRSSLIRQEVHIYYVIRNRFLFARRFYSHKKLLLFALWSLYGAYIALLALLKGQLQRARSILLACFDGWRGRFGPQNARITRGRLN